MSNEGRYRQRLNMFAANWRAMALRGLVALLFGLVVLFWPGLVLTVLALLFGIYAVVDGAITFVPALSSSERGARRWLPLTEGAVGVIAGLVAFLLSGMAGNGLVYIIAGWALATGMLKILTAILLRAEVESGWLLAGSGALSVLFGVLLAALAGSAGLLVAALTAGPLRAFLNLTAPTPLGWVLIGAATLSAVPLNPSLTSPGLLGSEPNHGVRTGGLARSFRGGLILPPSQ